MKYMKYFSICIAFLVALAMGFLQFWPAFGGTAKQERKRRIEQSIHFHDGQFVNRIPQSKRKPGQTWKLFKRQISGKEQRRPSFELPVIRLNKESFSTPPKDKLKAIWLGHASVYLEIGGLRVLVDPILSDYASPVQGVGPKRFHPSPVSMKDLPSIDVVVISHDHYDHLDMKTTQYLAAKGTRFFLPLGVGAHLQRWGVPSQQIVELEWNESRHYKGVRFISTEARHYSGRSFSSQKSTLWTSWSIISAHHKVFYSGDTGFSKHFAEIGKTYGPFDLSLMKIGAYGPYASWRDIHMSAEEAVTAHKDIKAKRMLPVHWASFNLAFHDWDEPIKRAKIAAQQQGVEMITPQLGEEVLSHKSFQSKEWWVKR